MCGIFGLYNLTVGRLLDEERFAAALATLQHRGPDGRKTQRIGEDALFGHARLSIIDLSDDSNQPMLLEGRYWLTYNGEIFNYIELRDELIALGVAFKTVGDVEVLLQAYIRWGPECVSRFNGMWAFAVYDMQERTFFASRDRFGIKPFNYAVRDGQLLFASEIKAILAYAPDLIEPDYNMIANFCRTSVGAQHAQTWFKGVQRLQPGCNMTVHDGRITIERYWNYPAEPTLDLSFEQATAKYRDLFDDAVRLRMRSDVPLGITLSAGLDSNSIAYAMQAADPSPHYCFTARFQDEENLTGDSAIYAAGGEAIDESVSARRVAAELGLKSRVVDTDYSNFVGALTRIVYHLESGNSSPAVLPLMQLLASARENLTVIMDGQGADELLAGYVTALMGANKLDLIAAGKPLEALASLREFRKTYTVPNALKLALRNASNRFPFLSWVQQRLTGLHKVYGPRLREYRRLADFPELPDKSGPTRLARLLRHQHSGGLVNLLHYGDAISMANSLEARMPFLDHRLVEFVWRLPAEHKIKLGAGKHVHREAMRGLVPDWILDNRVKYGFTTPIGNQFRKEFPPGEGPLDILLSERCIDRGLFDLDGLTEVIAAHREGRADHGPQLFRLLSTELWFRIFVDQA